MYNIHLQGEENTTYVLNNLSLSGSYALRVAAVNDAGTGIFSDLIEVEIEQEVTSNSDGGMGKQHSFSCM